MAETADRTIISPAETSSLPGETAFGVITSGVGGLYTVRCDDGSVVRCRAKGTFRREGMTPLAGDRVRMLLPKKGEVSDAARQQTPLSERIPQGADDGARIEEILPRKNALLRPAMANLDTLFLVIAARDPDPSLRFIDKLLAILEHEQIEPVLVVSKCDLDPDKAEKLRVKYEKCGYTVFLTDSETTSGDEAIARYLRRLPKDSISAFSGVSGAGKSTLLNRLFPELALKTGEISEKIARGKHTTRVVELYRLAEYSMTISSTDNAACECYLADTPGFSMLDFARFDFFPCEELAENFREFRPYIGRCRYTKCTHQTEDGCAILSAVAEKKIPRSRHTSYLELYPILKSKTNSSYK